MEVYEMYHILVPKDLLVRIDSVCSFVARRGLDEESKEELIAVSLACRKLYSTEIE